MDFVIIHHEVHWKKFLFSVANIPRVTGFGGVEKEMLIPQYPMILMIYPYVTLHDMPNTPATTVPDDFNDIPLFYATPYGLRDILIR